MKKLISILLVLGILTFGVLLITERSAIRAISGDWYITLDISGQLSDQVDFLHEVPLNDILVPYVLTFAPDGTYKFAPDEQALNDSLIHIRSKVGTIIINYYQAQGFSIVENVLQTAGLDMNLDSLLSDHDISLDRVMEFIFNLTGLSYNDILRNALPDEVLKEVLCGISSNGQYKVNFQTMFLTSSPDEEIQLGNSLSYEIIDDLLTIENKEMIIAGLPLTFSR